MSASKDLLVHRFNQHRSRAKRSGIPWRLAYWEWLQIWQDSGHLHDRGTYGGQWVMGRNGDVGAYEAGNVKIIRAETNSSEGQFNFHRRKRAQASSQAQINSEEENDAK
jgi:hypothetical protein